MDSKTLISQRNKLVADAGAIAQKTDITTEQRAQVKAMFVDIDKLQEDIDIAKRMEGFKEENRSAGTPPRGQPGVQNSDKEVNEAEVRSFEQYIRTGRMDASLESRAIGEGAIAGNLTVSAGIAVPTSVGDLTIVQKSLGNLAGSVKQLVSDLGNTLRLPIVDDTANDLVELAELADQGEVDPVVTSVSSTVDDLSSGLIVISNQLLNDAAFSVSEMISNIFNQRVIKGLNKRIYNGNSGSFTAITAGVPVKVTTASPTAIAWPELTQIFGAIDANYRANASWLVSSATHAYLMGITNPATGQPVLQPDVHGNPFGTLLGKPVVISEVAPAVSAGLKPILFGDLSMYTLRTVRQPTILRLTERFATQNATGFILFFRAGGVSVSQSSSPAIVSLQMHA
jgi:HK97 family phage major capsid protein